MRPATRSTETPIVWTCGVCFLEIWREDGDEAAWWSAILDHFTTVHPDAVAKPDSIGAHRVGPSNPGLPACPDLSPGPSRAPALVTNYRDAGRD